MENSPGSAPAYTGDIGAGASGADQGTGPIKEQARQVVQQAQQKAGDLAQQARDQVMSQLSGQKEQAAGTLDTITNAFRQTGQQLRDQGQGGVGGFVEQAAEFGDQFASYLREREVTQIVGEVEDFARRHPALFLGTAFTIGFFTARFLKSSAPSYGGDGAEAYQGAGYSSEAHGSTSYGSTGYGGGAYGTAGAGSAGYGTTGYGTTGYESSSYGTSGYAATTSSGASDSTIAGTSSLPTPLGETALAPSDTDDDLSDQSITGSEVR